MIGRRIAATAVLGLALAGCNALLGLGDPSVEGASDGSASDTTAGDVSPRQDGPGGGGDVMTADGGDASSATDSPGGGDSTTTDSSGGGGDSGATETGSTDSSSIDSSSTDSSSTDSGSQDSGPQDSSSSESGMDSGSPDTGAEAGPPTWSSTALGGTSDPITGIWFESQNGGVSGVVALQGATGGAGQIFGMSAPLVESKLLFSGNGVDAGGTTVTLQFQGLLSTHYGLIAPAATTALVGSTDNGNTFTVTSTGIADPNNTPLAWLEQDTSGRWTAVTSDPGGFPTLYQSMSGASLPTTWITVTGASQDQFFTNNVNPAYWQSPDGNTIVVPYTQSATPEVYVSSTAGASFSATPLSGTPSAGGYANVIAFAADGLHGIAASATGGSYTPYAALTSDGGNSWSNVALPASIVANDQVFGNAFLTPNGSRVWIIGYDGLNSNTPVFLMSEGGAAFVDLSTKLTFADQVASEWIGAGGAGAGAGFALDDTDIWLGSANGNLWYSPTGGQ